MPRLVRGVWLVALLTFLSGCSSTRHAVLPNSESTANGNSDLVVVEPNSKVRVTLVNGETVSGKVVRVSEGEVVLNDGNYGYAEQVISASEIASIEEEYISPSDNANNNRLFRAGVVAVLVAATAAVANGLSKLN